MILFEAFNQSNLSEEVFKWCLNLVVEHMEFRHSKSSSLPWSKSKKVSELKDPLTCFLIAFSEKQPVAFASYQFTSEPDLDDKPVPCLYLYELHVMKAYQNSGLGSVLLGKIEEIAGACGGEICEKIFLTAFKALPKNRLYKSPISFYLKHGFQVDPISPSRCLTFKKEASLYDYEILSKPSRRIE